MDSLLWNTPPSKPTVRPLVRIQLSLVAIGLMILVGYLNFHIGFFITLSMFYLFPILLAAIWVSVRFGLVLCFVASFLWVWSEIATGRPYGAAWSVVWNWLTRGAVFAAFCILLEMFLRERRQSLQDPLTGIANRRWFVIFAAQEIRRFRRYHQPFTALYLDCDDFKSVNDRLGHTGGRPPDPRHRVDAVEARTFVRLRRASGR